MHVVALLDLISSLLFLLAFYTVWNERTRFFSLRPLLPAVALLAIGRLCDMMLEHPSIHLSNLFHLSLISIEVVVAIIGNITDAVGISFLIFGFVKIIKYAQEEKKHIHNLEALLPICANCKKYRTKDNQWMPIEKYLIDNGAPQLTHGICPECAGKLYGDILKPKS